MIFSTEVPVLTLIVSFLGLTLSSANAGPRSPSAPQRPLAKPASRNSSAVKRPTQYEMLFPWVEAGQTLSVAKLKIFVDWASLDPQADQIVKTAMARFGATDLSSFLKLFVVDSNDSTPSSGGNKRGGETKYGELSSETIPILSVDQFSGADLEKVEPYRSQIEAIRVRKGAYFVYAVNRSVYLRVFTFSNPSIYLARNETLRQSYESFIHELTHFNRFDLRTEPNPLDFDSAEAFESAYLLAPGEEADARTTGVSALIRLLQKLPDETSLPVDLEGWFTPKGVLIAQPAQQLLVIRDFLGYHAQDLYLDRLTIFLLEDDNEWRALRALPASNAQAAARIEVLKTEIARANHLLSHAR